MSRTQMFDLAWTEDLAEAQFIELVELLRIRAECLRQANEADQRYHQRLREIAEPHIQSKLSACQFEIKPYDKRLVSMWNEGAANPMPKLDIHVTNRSESYAVLDSQPSQET